VKTEDFDKVLAEFAEEVNLAAKRTLGSRRIGKNRTYGVASRSLQKSLDYKISDGKVSFGSPLPYAAFIHWGVNGTRKNRNAPFSFKYENPSRKHVDSGVGSSKRRGHEVATVSVVPPFSSLGQSSARASQG
jgi:hypothetical protein